MRFLSPIASIALTVVCALSMVLMVYAHAEPARVSPGSGAVVIEPPAEVVIEMSQEMHREAGVEVTAVSAVVDNGNRRLLSVLMPGTLEPGRLTVRWKTLSSEDGDEAFGEYQFTFDPNGVADPGVEDVREDPLPPAESPTAPPGAVIVADGGDGGVTWILVAAVGVGMLTLGSGVTFLLVQKRG